ncbi:phosphopantetheine-binding protein [Actinoplanes sp. NPDC020271]|uniref:phosphopantetheine-binding protein n=1 Tax=Actinoplanes sp. NPDC020271 TaxID=3363896 RepID=UPI003798B492
MNKSIDRHDLYYMIGIDSIERMIAGGAPVSPAEPAVGRDLPTIVRTAVAQLLNVPEVSGSDNFFELGGHSLLAAQLLRSLESTVGYRPSFRHILDAADLDEISARISAEAVQRASAS